MEMDNVELDFDSEAINAVAKKAIELKTGARGLRTILEEHMMNIMYSTPMDKTIKKIVITPSVITNNEKPIVVRFSDENGQKETAVAE